MTLTEEKRNGHGEEVSKSFLSDKERTSKELESSGFKEDKNLGVPIDKGWGWVIVFCIFLNLFLVFGHNRSLSALFIDITEEFNQSKKVVALIFTVLNITGSIFTIISSNILLKHYTARRLTFLASLLNAICTIAVSQASSIGMWLCIYAIKGVAFGTLLVVPMSMLGHYFQKRKSLASSLAMIGNVVAYIIFPPLIIQIESIFGLRGAFLLMGGLELNLCAFAMLLRPPSSYRAIYAKKRADFLKKLRSNNSINLLSKAIVSQENKLSQSTKQSDEFPSSRLADPVFIDASCLEQSDTLNSRIILATNEDVYNKTTTPQAPQTGGGDSNPYSRSISIPPATSSPEPCLNYQQMEASSLPLLYSTSLPLSSAFFGDIDSADPYSKSMFLDDINEAEHNTAQIFTPAATTNGKNLLSLTSSGIVGVKSSKRFASENRLNSALTGSLLGVVYIGDSHEPDDEYDIGSDDGDGARCRVKLCSRFKLSTFIDTSLFKLWTFRMVVIYTACGSFSLFVAIYLPTAAYSIGISKSDAALLLTISGCVDVLSRVTVGFIADMECVSRELVVGASLFAVFILTQCARFYTTYTLFIMFALLSGVFLGLRQNLLNPMLLDYFGVEKTAAAFGICTMITNLVVAINHPIVGALADMTGTFTAALHYVGVFTGVGFLVLMTAPICKRWDQANLEKLENQNMSRQMDDGMQ